MLDFVISAKIPCSYLKVNRLMGCEDWLRVAPERIHLSTHFEMVPDPTVSEMQNYGPENDATFMRAALAQAELAERAGEVPIGAVVVFKGEIVGRGFNRNLLDHDPSAHAEMVAMREAARNLRNHRLVGCEMFVTMEPCAMCAGALVHARFSRLVYGASDPKAGAVSSVMQVLNHPKLNHLMDVTSGTLAHECSEMVKAFFRSRRAESK
jgi:tRNA(adenine34) deaminase